MALLLQQLFLSEDILLLRRESSRWADEMEFKSFVIYYFQLDSFSNTGMFYAKVSVFLRI